MEAMCLEKFCGQIVKKEQINEIIELVETFPKLSRTELAHTVCELFSWKRPTGKLKSVECRQFLERLDEKGVLCLPECRSQFAKKSKTKVARTGKADPQSVITGKLKVFSPIMLDRVETQEQRQLWYEYVDRYHYLGYQLPFGAQLRYFIESGNGENLIVGCLQMFKKLATFNGFKSSGGPFPIKKFTDGTGQFGATDSITGTDDLLYLINFIAGKGSSTVSLR